RRLRTAPTGARRTLAIERGGQAREAQAVSVPSSAAPVEKRPASGDELAPGIRYVDVSTLSDELWKKLLPDLAAARAIVFDLRGYPSYLPLAGPLANFTKQPLRSPQWHMPAPARPDREGLTLARSRPTHQ